MSAAAEFRAKLAKIMPGYDWTVHKVAKGATKLVATGTQSSGFNRLSTLEVTWDSRNGIEWYVARSAGYGRRAPWLCSNGDVTLARCIRGLQDQYKSHAATYAAHERALQVGRGAA
ncbi:hypothetical protein [uncultured Novosphingobium sp.]|uniref:hypothetical protein n=1 Tax=uncultured Novosphingobium sp. TaxID=292277 RepID=UPI002597FFBD|nr:hypothetical protein [uncultured Novosphingobium sp.]